jgi:hypothetical protein
MTSTPDPEESVYKNVTVPGQKTLVRQLLR